MNEMNLNQEVQETEEQSSFNFQTIYTAFILNWKWFVLSVIICLGIGFLYLKYTTPAYNTIAKILIKDSDNNKRSSRGGFGAIESMSNLGLVSSNYGIENEQQILTSTMIAEQAVRDLKLYTNYYKKKHFKETLLYKDQPVSVDMDSEHLDKLNAPVTLTITRKGNGYNVKGTYFVPVDDVTSTGPYEIDKNLAILPATINTRAGVLTLMPNGNKTLKEEETLIVTLTSPQIAARKYVAALTVDQTSKTSSVLNLQLKDENVIRSMDYLKQLVICYNRQANEDKNEVAAKTEEFINERLAKINAELGSTDSELENYKKRNRLMELKMDATMTSNNNSLYENKLNDAKTQIALINSLIAFADRPGNRHQVLPSNVGLNDEASTSLINEYNKVALERNRLLRTASENSPVVAELTSQLDDMQASIHQALRQALRNMTIQRNAIEQQLGQYSGEITKAPEQERILTQIGRQQEVKSGLYLTLLQKREENSISLAATADKSMLIESPQFAGKVSPKGSIIMLVAFIIGIAIPSAVLYIINFFSYKINGHEDVAKLTKLPIIADVLTASDKTKTRGEIVVHENSNDQMEEIFRSMRTNIQFMLKPGKNVLLFTSAMSGEGKTFTAANLAISFALLGKKVILVGLDIRKPRLAELFQIPNHGKGITPLLIKDNVQWSDIEQQIVPSEVNNNLDLLMAGPVPPNPTELVSRPSLDEVIGQLKEHYDYVLMDTAPVGLVSDTLQIGRLADISIHVCRADFTPKSELEMVNVLAKENKLPNMCIVINGIDISRKKHSYYYGYGKYGKYGRYGKTHSYGSYVNYGYYSNSHYGNKNDQSVKQ